MHKPNAPHKTIFPETPWSGVRVATIDPEALGRILGLYRDPLVEFLCRKGVPAANAEDLVHQFFTERFIEETIFLGRADAGRGRFRTYLCTALWRFCIDSKRAARARREAPNHAASIDDDSTPAGREDAEMACDVTLALSLLRLTIQRFAEACREKQRPDHLGLFEGLILALVTGGQPASWAELAVRWGFDTPKQAANAFQTVQNRFCRCWAKVLTENLEADPLEQGEELFAVLRKAGPELLDELRTYLWKELPSITDLNLRPHLQFPPEVMALLNPGPAETHDLAAVLRHVLTAPVWSETGDLAPVLVDRLRSVGGDNGLIRKSFLDLLQHPNPGLDLLVIVKEYAKHNRIDPDSPLPREVAIVLYYTVIATALVRCSERISDLENFELSNGWNWVVSLPWVDTELKTLCRAASTALGA